MKHRITLQAARTMAAEERTLTCATCDAPTPMEGETHCLSCKTYWEDVSNGLWDKEEYR